MTLGIIDVGTNSIHLHIGILGLNGKFHLIFKERDLTRLGQGGLAKGQLTHRGMNRAMQVLRRYAALINKCGVDHVEAVATSAVREATNGRVFVRRVRATLGLPLRIISGREEGRLIYLGVLQLRRTRRATMIVSIGGGSIEAMVGDGIHLRYVASLPLGCARLAERFIHHDPPQSMELDQLEREVRRRLKPTIRAMHRHRWKEALGSSATIEQLAIALYWREHRQLPKRKQPLIISQRALRRLVAWLSTSTAAERMRLPGVDPRREDLVLTTAVALLGWMEGTSVSSLRYAPGSLREGLVIDYLIRHHRRFTQQVQPSLTEVASANGQSEIALPQRHRLLKQLMRSGGVTKRSLSQP